MLSRVLVPRSVRTKCQQHFSNRTSTFSNAHRQSYTANELVVPNMCDSSTLVVLSDHMPRTHSLFRACIMPLARTRTAPPNTLYECTCTTSATAHVYNDTKRKRRRILSKKKRREVKKKKKTSVRCES